MPKRTTGRTKRQRISPFPPRSLSLPVGHGESAAYATPHRVTAASLATALATSPTELGKSARGANPAKSRRAATPAWIAIHAGDTVVDGKTANSLSNSPLRHRVIHPIPCHPFAAPAAKTSLGSLFYPRSRAQVSLHLGRCLPLAARSWLPGAGGLALQGSPGRVFTAPTWSGRVLTDDAS